MAQAFETDGGFGTLARLGLIVLSTDESLENEARLVLGDRAVSMMHTRIPAEEDVTPDALRMMENRLPEAARLLPQGQDAIGYGCTSASTVIGPERVAELVRGHHPGAQVSNPISAVIAALRALEVGRIAYVSPYVPSVTAPMRVYLETQGITTVIEDSFAEGDDRTVAHIAEKSSKIMVLDAIAKAKVEAVFVSCTNLRTFGIIDEVERETGLPVVSSNQALLWHMLRLAGVDARGWGPGRLFSL
ncbi:MAG: Asp/Glu racemase [Sediminimonas sp.]|uniref:maleate cis-trans isomerase family protein n=1 Tax=Sediminimonas sp. TaxID=2823379 RepID=UPI00286FE19D|nr:Asp/Glu racemase [Sediminimonas sp.]MDR9483933.1 Asp/Glu racemase [Sediminimonas sp.]